jgi:hypothetical protein
MGLIMNKHTHVLFTGQVQHGLVNIDYSPTEALAEPHKG